jgi:hypothetical protein
MPSDIDIEHGLRQKAASDPRAAEVLLRWLQRPQAGQQEQSLHGLSRGELERLHTTLIRLSRMEESALEALIEHVEATGTR